MYNIHTYIEISASPHPPTPPPNCLNEIEHRQSGLYNTHAIFVEPATRLISTASPPPSSHPSNIFRPIPLHLRVKLVKGQVHEIFKICWINPLYIWGKRFSSKTSDKFTKHLSQSLLFENIGCFS